MSAGPSAIPFKAKAGADIISTPDGAMYISTEVPGQCPQCMAMKYFWVNRYGETLCTCCDHVTNGRGRFALQTHSTGFGCARGLEGQAQQK